MADKKKNVYAPFQKAHYSTQFQCIHYLQWFFIPAIIPCVKGFVRLSYSLLQ